MTPANPNTMYVGFAIVLLIVLLVILAIVFNVLGLYVRALVSGAPISVIDILGMRLRKLDARTIVQAYVIAKREKLPVTLQELQAQMLVGGDVAHCVSAMLVAQRGGTPLSWQDVTTLDLAGRDAIAFAQGGAVRRPGMNLVAAAPMRQPAMNR